MKREEAIKFLTLMRKAVSNFEEYGHDKASLVIECDKAEAIDIAIEALHREEAEEKGYCHRIRPKADAEPTETSTLGEKHQLSHGRLIDADELKKHLDGAWEELNDDGERKGVRLARWYLISAPTVDSTIDVVRCKDCRYRNGKVNSKGFEVCDATGMDITDNDFCSWGERREK